MNCQKKLSCFVGVPKRKRYETFKKIVTQKIFPSKGEPSSSETREKKVAMQALFLFWKQVKVERVRIHFWCIMSSLLLLFLNYNFITAYAYNFSPYTSFFLTWLAWANRALPTDKISFSLEKIQCTFLLLA